MYPPQGVHTRDGTKLFGRTFRDAMGVARYVALNTVAVLYERDADATYSATDRVGKAPV